MFKYLRYISLFICLFLLFNLNVEAKVYNSGICIYNFTNITGKSLFGKKGEKGNLSIKVTQDSNGKHSYYYFADKDKVLTSATDSRWILEKKGTDNIHIDYVIAGDSSYDNCNKYGHYRAGGYVKFSDSPVEDRYDNVIQVNAYPKLYPSTSTDGEGATCDQTKKDWQSGVDDASEKKHYCLYYGDDVSGKVGGFGGILDKAQKKTPGCYIIQIGYSTDKTGISVSSNISKWNSGKNSISFGFDDRMYNYLKTNGCPTSIGIGYCAENSEYAVTKCPKNANIVLSTTVKSGEQSFKVNGTNAKFSLYLLTRGQVVPENAASSSIIISPTNKISDCKELLPEDLRKYLKNLVILVRVLVPLILIAFGIVDFGGAVFAGDEDKMKKSQSKFIKRLIIALVIFTIPILLKFILGVASSIWPVIDSSLCDII